VDCLRPQSVRWKENDKTLVRDDIFIHEMKTNPLWASIHCQTYADMEGGVNDHFGVHTVNDGGYHKWLASVSAGQPDEAGTVGLENHGRVHEGVRKDSKCTLES